jgi:hypothetical protein
MGGGVQLGSVMGPDVTNGGGSVSCGAYSRNSWRVPAISTLGRGLCWGEVVVMISWELC